MKTEKEASNNVQRDENTHRALLRSYVGKNYEKYQIKWDKSAAKKSKQSWNWAAFFFSFGWLAYRKMYAPAAIWIGLLVGEAIVSLVFGYPQKYSNLVALGLAFGAGQVGNTIYEEHATKKIALIKESRPSSDWLSALRSQGGVSWFAGIGAFIGCFILLLIVFALADAI